MALFYGWGFNGLMATDLPVVRSLSVTCLFQVFQFRNWVEAVELCALNLKAELKSINFNPSNWHQFNGIDDDGLKVWNFDKVNDQYFLEQRCVFF